MNLLKLIGLGTLAAVSAPAQAQTTVSADCPAERAVYTMAAEGAAFEIAFVPARHHASVASDLYLRLTTPQRRYWFQFAVSNGYGGTSLNPVSDPYAEAARPDGPRDLLSTRPDGEVSETLSTNQFYALDADLDFLASPPSRSDPAPPFVMIPELGLTLWYAPQNLTEDRAASRDPMPRGVFKRTACLVAPHPEAYP